MSKYLIEFCVIILSILVAFGLERYYESYLDDKYLDELLIDVRNELIYDLKESEGRHGTVVLQDRMMSDFFNKGKLPMPHVVYSPNSALLLISTNAYKEWNGFSEEIPKKYDSLNILLTQIKNRFPRRMETHSYQLFEFINDYKRYLRSEKWYYELSQTNTLSKTAKDFILNDITMKSFLAQYHEQIQIVRQDYYHFRYLTILALFEINKTSNSSISIGNYQPLNQLSLSDKQKELISGTYQFVHDTAMRTTYSFIEGYLHEENLNGPNDIYYLLNDSTFSSMAGSAKLEVDWEEADSTKLKIGLRYEGELWPLSKIDD